MILLSPVVFPFRVWYDLKSGLKSIQLFWIILSIKRDFYRIDENGNKTTFRRDVLDSIKEYKDTKKEMRQ
jgi:hypothetical protein